MKMTVCLQSVCGSVDEIVSGEVDVDETSTGRCRDDADGRGPLPMNETASPGGSEGTSGRG